MHACLVCLWDGMPAPLYTAALLPTPATLPIPFYTHTTHLPSSYTYLCPFACPTFSLLYLHACLLPTYPLSVVPYTFFLPACRLPTTLPYRESAHSTYLPPCLCSTVHLFGLSEQVPSYRMTFSHTLVYSLLASLPCDLYTVLYMSPPHFLPLEIPPTTTSCVFGLFPHTHGLFLLHAIPSAYTTLYTLYTYANFPTTTYYIYLPAFCVFVCVCLHLPVLPPCCHLCLQPVSACLFFPTACLSALIPAFCLLLYHLCFPIVPLSHLSLDTGWL